MALSDADSARLAQLRIQRDALIGGTKVRRITHGQRTKEMVEGDPAALQAEIDRLEAMSVTSSSRRRGAVTFRFRS